MSDTTLLGLGLMLLIGFLAGIGYELRLVDYLICGMMTLLGIYAKDGRVKKKQDKKEEEQENDE